MLLETDYQKLEQLAKNFNHISQTSLTIYDDQKRPLCAYPHNMCDFCTEIRKNPVLQSRCLACDRAAFQQCQETRKLYMYHCHMGLIEVAAPIIYNHMILGYMLFGQITDEQDRTKLITLGKQTAIDYQLDIDRIVNGLNALSCRSKDYIESISQLLEMCANYIWLNNIISMKTNSLAYSLEAYVRAHLTEELPLKRLCHEFGVSRSALYQLAKDQFGCGVSEYVQQCRIQKAKDLLKKQPLTVSQVADMVGMGDVNYFIRLFKKQTGMTPKKFQTSK